MQSHKNPINPNDNKKETNSPNTISDLATRNVFVGIGIASILYPLDLGLHTLYSKVHHSKPMAMPSAQPCRVAVMAAAWNSYKYAVTGATMRATTKQQSQGAKAYLLDDKFTPVEEGIEPIEGVPELIESKMPKQNSLRNTGTAVVASMLFGGVEAFITQTNANNSILSKEHLLATKQGRVFVLPQIQSYYDRIRYRIAGLPLRSAKSSFQVGAFMATDAMEKFLLAKGNDMRTAKTASITSVAAVFGLGISLLNRGYTEQILTMNPSTITVDSAKKIIPTMIKNSGPKRIFMESLMSMFYTGVVQAIVPPIEKHVEENVIPKKRDLQSRANMMTAKGVGFFDKNTVALDSQREVKVRQVDEDDLRNHFGF